jgi:FAD:protein FMN transferase
MTSRRRVLSILAGVAALPVLGTPAAVAASEWRGVVLGAPARIILDHPDADRLIVLAIDEIRRLEAIFSLHRADSQLSRLNRDGGLSDPAFEMVELLSVCAGLHARTRRAFDPTVQTLWTLYAERFSAGKRPGDKDIKRAHEATGWQHVRFDPARVGFGRAGVQLTFNGVAQGYVADKVVALLQRKGVLNVLVNTGEIAALGTAPDGHDWQVRLKDATGPRVALRNGAIATSSVLGTTFDQDGQVGHILDPRTGLPGRLWAAVSVRSASAAIADGLSTGFSLMQEAEIDAAKGDDLVWLERLGQSS